MECKKPVEFEYEGKKYRLVPDKVWELKNVKVALFTLPGGKRIRRKTPADYPVCG